MAGSCPCGDLRCVCVRPCLCCSCTCWCDECRRLRKEQQLSDLDGGSFKAAHFVSFSVGPVGRRFFTHEAAGHCSSNAEAAVPKISIKNDESEDSDEEMLEIGDDRCSLSGTVKAAAEGNATNVPGSSSAAEGNATNVPGSSSAAEGSATNVPGCSSVNLNMNLQKCSQPQGSENKRIIDLSGCSMLDSNANIINPEQYRQFLISQRSSNANLSASSTQESDKAMEHVPGSSQSSGVHSEHEESKTTGATSVAESPKMSLEEHASHDSTQSDKSSSISRSPASSSIFAPSAFGVPQPRQELGSRQQIPSPQNASPASASTSRKFSMLAISAPPHSADQRIPESKSPVKPISECAACGYSSKPPSPTERDIYRAVNDVNDKITTILDKIGRSDSPDIDRNSQSSPEKSDNLAAAGPSSSSEVVEMELSSDEDGEEEPSSSDKTNVSRKC